MLPWIAPASGARPRDSALRAPSTGTVPRMQTTTGQTVRNMIRMPATSGGSIWLVSDGPGSGSSPATLMTAPAPAAHMAGSETTAMMASAVPVRLKA